MKINKMEEIVITQSIGTLTKYELENKFRSIFKKAQINFIYQIRDYQYGRVSLNNKSYFFKVKPVDKCIDEIRNYNKIKECYPLAEMEYLLRYFDQGILLFKYEDSIEKEDGLFLDIPVGNKSNQKKCEVLYEIFLESFKKSQAFMSSYSSEKYFSQRLCRIEKLLNGDKRLIKILDYKFRINGELYPDSTRAILESLIEYFSKPKSELCFLSQGDPTLINIGTKPIFFDYETSGMNPLLGEFAIFFWAVFIAESYYHPKYNPKSYRTRQFFVKDYPKYQPGIKKGIKNNEREIVIELDYQPNSIKKKMIREYYTNFINKSLRGNEKELNNFRYFLAMRVLCTFDMAIYSSEDLFSTLAFLHLFCNSNDFNKNIALSKLVGAKK